MHPPSPFVPQIFSPERQRRLFRRALTRQRSGAAARFIAEDMWEDVNERLAFMHFRPERALVIGDAAGLVAEGMERLGTAVERLDAGEWAGDEPLGRDAADLIVHDTSLAAINDLPGALLHLRHGLRPGGLLIGSIIGAGSLPALRHAMLSAEPDQPYARLHPQIDNRTASALLQRAGFAKQVVDTHDLTVRYGGMARLVDDLRDQGLGNALCDLAPPLNRVARQQAEQAFCELADADGKVSERFSIITLTAWR